MSWQPCTVHEPDLVTLRRQFQSNKQVDIETVRFESNTKRIRLDPAQLEQGLQPRLIDRFKDINLSFSLNRDKFGRLLQLSFYGDELVNIWFDEFASDRFDR